MYRGLIYFFFIVIFPSLVFGLEIRFKKEAVVDGPVITLGSVATISPFSKSQVLSDLVLFPAPLSGERKCYGDGALKAYVIDAVINKDSIRWEGAERICIRRREMPEKDGDIQSAVNNELRKALAPLSAEQVFFKASRWPETLKSPSGRVEYTVHFSDKDILKSRQVNVIARVDGRVEKNVTIAGRVHALLPVLVTNEALKRGTVIAPDHLRREVKNVAELNDPCLNTGNIVGKILKRSVGMNQVLSDHDIELPDLVERRQVVTMLLQKGGLQITTKGIAVTSGKMGEVIMVKNMTSHRMVPCRVTGAGMTLVEF